MTAAGVSKIAADTAASLLAIFAGQTVPGDAVYAQIEQEYTLARKRTGMGSYAQVLAAIERAGAFTTWSGPSSTGDLLYIFPAAVQETS